MSQELKVMVYYNRDLAKILFSANNTTYVLSGDQGKIGEAGTLREFIVSATGDSLMLSEAGKKHSKFSFLNFSPLKPDSFSRAIFTIKPQPGNKARNYSGDLRITSVGGVLHLLNGVDIESYVGGVIQGEVGSSNPYEFKKMKAIIIRTYALSNMYKHMQEGFHLCDKVHCQVYNGVSYQPQILSAVKETNGKVLVDDSVRVISTSFFSNCGGQTCNSEDVWSKPFPYLVSVTDSFCKGKTSYAWTRKILKKDWLAYFAKKFNYPVMDSAFVGALLRFDQPSRKKHLVDTGFCIPLRTLREDWNLRSTFFSVNLSGEYVILNGRGFGHGVGLCQEGAMEMARKGYSVMQIISYYYKNVKLADLSRLEFYRHTESD